MNLYNIYDTKKQKFMVNIMDASNEEYNYYVFKEIKSEISLALADEMNDVNKIYE